MKYRKLGRDGPAVSAIGMGRGSGPVRAGDPLEQDFNAAIRRAYELGINFFDSSDAYWDTRHETLLGHAIQGFRNEVVLSSKFGNIDLPDGKKGTNGRPEYALRCCDESLKRMGVDVIDVYYLHRVDPGVPIEETVGAMGRLIERGKVRWWSASTRWRSREARRPRRLRWRGYWRRASSSCPSRVPIMRPTSSRTRPPRSSS